MFEWMCSIQDKIRKVQLSPQQDLDNFVNEIHNVNMTLNEAQPHKGIPSFRMVNIMLHQLQTLQYADQIKLIMTAYHATALLHSLH